MSIFVAPFIHSLIPNNMFDNFGLNPVFQLKYFFPKKFTDILVMENFFHLVSNIWHHLRFRLKSKSLNCIQEVQVFQYDWKTSFIMNRFDLRRHLSGHCAVRSVRSEVLCMSSRVEEMLRCWHCP